MTTLSHKHAILTAVTLCCTYGMAQTSHVVTDMETGTPISDVTIIFNNIDSCRTKTEYTGIFTCPDSARTLTFKHSKYEGRMMDRHELKDTIELLPNMNRLNEVVIKGKRPKISPFVMGPIKDAALSAPRQTATATFDVVDLFTWKKRKKTKKRIKAIENY